jgi:erythromycin esterase-like protein
MLYLFAEVASETATHPWWLTAITGSGGALIILMMWVKNLTATVKKKDTELMEISRQSIECITKILERQNQDKDWKDRLNNLLDEIHEYIKSVQK